MEKTKRTLLRRIVNGAKVYDSQLAIPLKKMTEGEIFFCYPLMDAILTNDKRS
jgi:hypothetical protein